MISLMIAVSVASPNALPWLALPNPTRHYPTLASAFNDFVCTTTYIDFFVESLI